jgi:ATP synthase F1 complex assembly factor 1
MQFMEWALLPADDAGPPPATTLFTPLAEYKLKQEYSQPLLVLTYYLDLAHSHNIVLIRGEITQPDNPVRPARIDTHDAQLLALTLQRFYLHASSPDATACAALLHSFHKQPNSFDVQQLVQLAFKL